LAYCAGADLRWLIDLASEGNKTAGKSLHKLLVGSVWEFEQICDATPEVFEPIARKTCFWPGFITCDRDLVRQNADRVLRLNLGLEAGLNYTGKQWTCETLETRKAVGLYVRVMGQRETWLRRAETRQALERLKKRFPRLKRTSPPPQPNAKFAEFTAKHAEEFSLYNETYELAKKLQPLTRKNYA
jgi:hypothetical protein